ncbi:ankyrin repeat domain-containing protein [Candidatus Dependentiae bacterium]|nr:ankyrin repeat domain-containing protein [Candidatus Dependentiae bacterium]
MKLINVIGIFLALTAFVGKAMKPNNSIHEQLFDAVKNGNCALVEHLLNLEELSSGDPQLDMCDQLLYVAAKHGHIDLVQLLLSKGAKSDGEQGTVYHYKLNDLTPLHAAAKKGHLAIVELLLCKKADVNLLGDYNCYSPIHLAVKNEHIAVVKVLLKYGADPNIRNEDDYTSLALAAETGNELLVKLLLNKGALLNLHGNDSCAWVTPLHVAAKKGDLALAQLLLDVGADINADLGIDEPGVTALHWAAENGHVEVVKLLLDNGAAMTSLNSCAKSPLQVAFENRHVPVVDLLINYHASYINSWEHLHGAVRNGNMKFIKFLLAKGVDVTIKDNKNRTALHSAMKNTVGKGYWYTWEEPNADKKEGVEVIKLLIDKGLEINAQDGTGNTPLCLAVEYRNRLAIEILLSYGASIRQDLLADSILQQAQDNRLKLSQTTEFKAIAQLLSKDAYAYPVIQMQVDEKRRKLFKAIQSNNVQSITKLLKEGFSLNTCDKEGNTLLHKAIESNSLQVVDLLLSLGAHKYIDKANKQGFTPMQFLVSKGLLARALSPRANADQLEQKIGVKRKH